MECRKYAHYAEFRYAEFRHAKRMIILHERSERSERSEVKRYQKQA